MANKIIEMTVREGSNSISHRFVIDRDASWRAQAYIFHKFLLAQGYNLEGESVGSEVSDFVAATENIEEDQW